jgi:hypothetical protein
MTEKAKPEQKPTGLALLREPFPENLIAKLPKPTKAQTDALKENFKIGIRCPVCGGWHHKDVVHLDYVGHAALTHRLLDADPAWFWEPAALVDGLPAFDKSGGLWIKLTVCGVTRLGYGHAATKPNMDPGAREKEVIGDALRNAAMRFGAALDLWHKGDLHGEPEAETEAADEPTQETPAPQRGTKANSRELFSTLQKGLRGCKSSNELRQWGTAFADDIKKMDKSFADQIRAEYKAEMNAFMDHEIAEEQANADQ